MNDLNYPEIPDSWNNKEKTKMANFNEKINSETGYILDSQDFFIYRAEAMDDFEQNIDDDLYCRTNAYRLFIQYKTTHRVKKMAGRCFLWDNSHGDHMKDPGNGIELRSINDASQDDCEGFGNPRFDDVSAAIFITDQDVFVYGDVQIEADDISKDKKHVFCTVSLCGSMVSCFRIPAEVFDSLFGLKENFPKQYENQVEEENDLIEEANGKDIVLKEFLGDLYNALMVLTNNDKQRVLKILEHYADKSGFFERIKEHIEYLESEIPNSRGELFDNLE